MIIHDAIIFLDHNNSEVWPTHGGKQLESSAACWSDNERCSTRTQYSKQAVQETLSSLIKEQAARFGIMSYTYFSDKKILNYKMYKERKKCFLHIVIYV